MVLKNGTYRDIDIVAQKESTERTWGDVIGKFDDFAVSTSYSRELTFKSFQTVGKIIIRLAYY